MKRVRFTLPEEPDPLLFLLLTRFLQSVIVHGVRTETSLGRESPNNN